MIVLLESEIQNQSFLEPAMAALISSHAKELYALDLPKDKANGLLLAAASWVTTRPFAIQLISTDGNVPEYHLNFVDELDQDPDFIAMQKALKRK